MTDRTLACEFRSNDYLAFIDDKGMPRTLIVCNPDKGSKEINFIHNDNSKNSIETIKKPNMGTFIIGCTDTYLEIYDSKKKEPVSCLKVIGDLQHSIITLTILNDKYLVCGSQNGQVKIFDENNTCVARFEANSAVKSLSATDDGKVLIGCEDGTLYQLVLPLQAVIPIDDENLLKPFEIANHLVSILKDEDGREVRIEEVEVE